MLDFLGGQFGSFAEGPRDGALPWGVYHYRGDPPASWHAVAAVILEEVARHGRHTPPLAAIDSAAYGAAARRPRYSVLDCAKIAAAFGVAPAPWRPRLAAMVEAASPGIVTVPASWPGSPGKS